MSDATQSFLTDNSAKRNPPAITKGKDIVSEINADGTTKYYPMKYFEVNKAIAFDDPQSAKMANSMSPDNALKFAAEQNAKAQPEQTQQSSDNMLYPQSSGPGGVLTDTPQGKAPEKPKWVIDAEKLAGKSYQWVASTGQWLPQ